MKISILGIPILELSDSNDNKYKYENLNNQQKATYLERQNYSGVDSCHHSTPACSACNKKYGGLHW